MDIEPKRKFFLFEPKPVDFFLAMEVGRLFNISNLKMAFYKSVSPTFVKRLWFVRNTEDSKNKGGFLDVMNSFSDDVLDNEKSANYGHVFHCILNAMGYDRKQEAVWYYKLLKERLDGIKRSHRKKKISKRV